ncbi:mucin-binding protein [Fructilactobacillus cliffordii]|uniref:MucBP domain-containing protein n=1 Tax=Fructilactobacillus cliffordii TaxID=2940299 RepID=A0A9Q9E349_9LACO|nr:MucBP domain-containing protein [Fructilactobacillus cliffordii]USS89213.1 MucBP domain-containing protein [Fructilactobacillus cliffordii]
MPFKDSKTHYKMYKAGKQWLFSAITVTALSAGFFAFNVNDVHADTNSLSTQATANSSTDPGTAQAAASATENQKATPNQTVTNGGDAKQTNTDQASKATQAAPTADQAKTTATNEQGQTTTDNQHSAEQATQKQADVVKNTTDNSVAQTQKQDDEATKQAATTSNQQSTKQKNDNQAAKTADSDSKVDQAKKQNNEAISQTTTTNNQQSTEQKNDNQAAKTADSDSKVDQAKKQNNDAISQDKQQQNDQLTDKQNDTSVDTQKQAESDQKVDNSDNQQPKTDQNPQVPDQTKQAAEQVKTSNTTLAVQNNKSENGLTLSVQDPDYGGRWVDPDENHYTFKYDEVYGTYDQVHGVKRVVFSTDRNGSGIIHVFELDENNQVIASYDISGDGATATRPNRVKSRNINGYYFVNYGGYSGAFQLDAGVSSSIRLRVDWSVSDHNGNSTKVGNDSFFIPTVVDQRVQYKDAKTGEVVYETHFSGLTGQNYSVTGLPDKVKDGYYYISKIPSNVSGTISQFGKVGQVWSTPFRDGTTMTYTETDDHGGMDVRLYAPDGTQFGKTYHIDASYKYNDSTQVYSWSVSNPSNNPHEPANGRYIVQPIYTPQSRNIQFEINKLSKLVPVDSNGNPIDNGDHDVPYTIDPNDPTKANPTPLPNIPGYVPLDPNDHSKTTTPGTTVPINDPGTETKVPYVVDHQNAVIHYVDDQGNELHTDQISGKINEHSDYSPDAETKALQDQGYKQISSDFPQGGIVLSYNNGNQLVYTITFKKTTETVTDNSGVSNITIKYRYSDGSQAAPDKTFKFTYHRTGTRNLDTNNVVWGDWVPDGDNSYNVPSPQITGYTPDKPSVSSQNVAEGTDATINITYIANYESAHVDYIDQDADGKVITSDTLNGQFGDTSDYSTKDKIAALEKQGYELVSDGYTPGYKFGEGDPTFKVILKHKTTTVTPDNPGQPGQPVDPNNPDGPKFPNGTDESSLVKNITRTIKYRYANGQEAAKTVTESVKYTRSITFDQVTGKIIATGDWKSDKNSYDAVASPVIPGYTADQPSVGAATTTPNDSDSDVTVTYHANDEKAHVEYVDQDAGGKVITSDTLNGKFGDTSDYSTKDQIAKLGKQGYELVNDGYTPGYKFGTDEPTFKVTLKHKTTTVTPDNPGNPGQPVDPNNPDGPKFPNGTDESSLVKNITRTIKYRYANGQEAAKTVTESVKYTRSITFDQVTGKIIATGDWKSDKNSYDAVASPVIPGYTADQPSVGAATTTPNDSDSDVTVTYHANDEKAHVEYVDQDAGGKVITSDTLNGKFGDTSDYSTKDQIAKLGKQGYELVNDGYTPGYKFGTDEPTFKVTLKHKTTTVTPDNPGNPGQPVDPNNPDGPKFPNGTDESSLVKNITRTIKYRYANGQEAAKTVTESVKYTRSITFDQVTGKIIATGDWKSDKNSYDAVASPVIPGYTADQPSVGAATTTPNDSDSDVTVTYHANDEKAHVEYVDQDENGKVITSDTLNGKFGDTSDYSTKDQIAKLEKQGYELVNDGYTPGYKFGTDEPTFKVTLKHKTTTVTPDNPGQPGQPVDPNNPDGPKFPNDTDESSLVKNITRTIKYRYANGQEAAKTVTESVKYTRSITFDQVTGKIIANGDWKSDKNSYDAVASPVIPGYTADQPSVGAATTTPNDSDSDVTVTYHANDEKAHVVYVDQDENGKVITSDTLNGKFGDTSDYSTKTKIAELEKQGYEIVNDGYTPGYKFGTDEPTFKVTLKHKTTTVTPDNPGKPGQPVDTNNPDGPKFPNGTDESSLVKNITRTIHYRLSNGQEVSKDVTETVKYTRSITFDQVTGKIIETGKWTSQGGSWNSVKSPVINGYYTRTPLVGAVTVTPKTQNAEITVTYLPLGHLVPDVPGTTPETYPNDPNDPSKINDPLIPDIPGYTPVDGNGNKLVPGTPYPISPENIGKDTPIHYIKNEIPAKPAEPTKPSTPSTPTNPAPTETPATPAQPAPVTPAAQHSTPVVPASKKAAPTPAPQKQVLPQTGESQSTGILSLIGAILLSLLGIFGYKRKEDK